MTKSAKNTASHVAVPVSSRAVRLFPALLALMRTVNVSLYFEVSIVVITIIIEEPVIGS